VKETIGIPRALLYYYFYPAWRAFFESLGRTCRVSGKTTKSVIDSGIKVTVDEACLPVKAYHGHVMALSGECDNVFVPRLVSVERKAYICPKLMGSPDHGRKPSTFRPPGRRNSTILELTLKTVVEKLPPKGVKVVGFRPLQPVCLGIGVSTHASTPVY
jgi:hypothetical protein